MPNIVSIQLFSEFFSARALKTKMSAHFHHANAYFSPLTSRATKLSHATFADG
jgi:hypothetical protein